MSNKFDAWLNDHPSEAQGFAERIGVAEMTLWRYRRGQRIPRPREMGAIYVETGGEIEPNDFYGLPSLRSRNRGARRETAGAA